MPNSSLLAIAGDITVRSNHRPEIGTETLYVRPQRKTQGRHTMKSANKPFYRYESPNAARRAALSKRFPITQAQFAQLCRQAVAPTPATICPSGPDRTGAECERSDNQRWPR